MGETASFPTLPPDEAPALVPPWPDDYWRQVPAWSMAGNDRFGDCVFAACANHIDLVKAVNGDPQVVSEAEAERFYAVEAGFNPMEPVTDQGAAIEDALDYWHENGWPADPTYKCGPRMKIDRKDVPAAIKRYGAVYGFVMLPNMDDDLLWTDAVLGSPPRDGHAVLIVGAQNGFQIVSWGEKVDVSRNWWTVFGRDCWAVMLPDWKEPG